MKFNIKIMLLPLLVYALFPAVAACLAGELGNVLDKAGNPPKTSLIDQPHEALRLWQEQGQKGRTLVIISEDLPLIPLDESIMPHVLKDIAEGRWDDILAKGYISPVFRPVNRSYYAYAANRAGIISRIYWVPPTKTTVGKETAEQIIYRFRSLGAGESELESLKTTDTAVTGSVQGVPVHICNLRDIPPINEEVILAVDLTFFSILYKDEVTTPFLDLFTSFILTLADSGIKVSHAVISYSNALDIVPLEQRFIGGYIEQFLARPETLAEGPPAEWLYRSEAMYHETFFQVEEALQLYSQAVDANPKDPSLRFDLALSYFSNKNVDRMKEELDAAVALDRGYYPAYITYGRYFAGKGLMEAAEDFIEEAVKAEPNDPKVWNAKHDVMRAAGKSKEALDAQKRYIALGFDGPEPLYDLAQDYAALSEYGPAIENYSSSLRMLALPDTTLRPQVLLGLAEAYEKTGRVQDALDAYEDALDATADEHAWMRINEKCESLKRKWAPFMRGGGD